MTNADRINSQLSTLVDAMQKLRDAGVDGDVIAFGCAHFDERPRLQIHWRGFVALFRGKKLPSDNGQNVITEWNGVDLTACKPSPQAATEITIE